MSNYFELYKTILVTIHEHSPETGHQLFNALSSNDSIIHEKDTNPNLVKDTLLILDNLINDGLVYGKITPTKSGNIYELSGLSSAGYQYLLEMKTPNISDKLIEYVKENGIPLTPQAITKFLAQLIF